MKNTNNNKLEDFFGDGFFDWQFTDKAEWKYDEEKYWGGFSREPIDMTNYSLPDWAIGPFIKYPGNPVLAPSKDGWDCGRYGGGVHNGSIIKKNGKFYYIYRGEMEYPPVYINENNYIDYICDIGIAISDDGIHFEKDTVHSPVFRKGKNEKYSFEDVNVVKYKDLYYLFCNRWDWRNATNPRESGIFLAVSEDLLHWEEKGLVFPDAKEIHRNPCVVQNPDNEAVKINGKFVMYINNGLIAYSDDLLNWQSTKVKNLWPGGEGCFALTDYSEKHSNKVLLFTGGHHTGHFYAIGEVLFSKDNLEEPVDWLPRPVIHAEPEYPYEDGLSAEEPHLPVSYWKDTVFFTGMTRHNGKWMLYYGGSEYYTCLATSE